ncbi:condensation domain-containing protein, partial [Undibacterium sp. TJN19]|uniref:condensation domain-containing protein n=1 Tax=Undibacterium sp. TJN19 TaxID=3413055 RepID=UPI003BF3E5B5
TSANRGVHSPILPRSSREAEGQPEEAVLSYAQQRLWLMDQLMGAHHAYNISLAIRLSGDLQAGHLRTSLQRILQRHDILRTRYTSHQGQPRLITDPPATLELIPQPVTDEQHIQALWRDERQHAFNLAEEPLIRLRLLEVDSHQHVLLITLHHIIADAWSLGIFFNELITSYRDLSQDKRAGADAEPLAPLAIQYSDYAHWQRTHLQQDQLRRQCDYWREQLHELPAAIHLPLDFPRPEERRFHGAAAYIHLPAALTTRIRQLGLQTDTTLFMTLFAAFSLLLGRRCGEQDIPIGTPVANRGRRETENLIGFFVNLLVLRSDLSGQPSFNDLLRRTRATVLDAYAHQDIAFEYLVEIIEPERDLNQSPLFQVLFALQNAPAEDIALDQLQMQPLIAEEHEG